MAKIIILFLLFGLLPVTVYSGWFDDFDEVVKDAVRGMGKKAVDESTDSVYEQSKEAVKKAINKSQKKEDTVDTSDDQLSESNNIQSKEPSKQLKDRNDHLEDQNSISESKLLQLTEGNYEIHWDPVLEGLPSGVPYISERTGNYYGYPENYNQCLTQAEPIIRKALKGLQCEIIAISTTTTKAKWAQRCIYKGVTTEDKGEINIDKSEGHDLHGWVIIKAGLKQGMIKFYGNYKGKCQK